MPGGWWLAYRLSAGRWSAGPACRVPVLPLPAGVGFEGGGAESFEPGEQFAQPPVVVDPGLVVPVLVGAGPAADGLGGDLAGPLPVRSSACNWRDGTAGDRRGVVIAVCCVVPAR